MSYAGPGEPVVFYLDDLLVILFVVVGWGTDQRGFGEDPGMKTQILNLIRSIRTVMRSRS